MAAPALLGTGWLLTFFAALLSPGRVLANRDIPFFHLPLRTALRQLAEFGLPVWNPWLHGGQPVLSNPSYAAFYPPGWLIFLFEPAYAINLLVLFHGAVAFAGAWFLARRLGAGRGAAALAAVGYTGGGALLSLLSAFTLYCSMAWFPWVMAWGEEALRVEKDGKDDRGDRGDEDTEGGGALSRAAGEGRRGGWLRGNTWLRPALLCGGALALQLLNGEPATVVVSGLGLLAMAFSTALRRPLAALRSAVPVAVAVALAAAQLVPTLGRLAGTPRAEGLGSEMATVWSAPPERLAEVIFPRFFGDATRHLEGLFFGWGFHDNDYPYVISVYPGLLLAILGISALALWPIPRRAAWWFAVGASAFLALGRHNPLFEALREAVPVLSVLRFPEKFILLALAALAFAGVLGWQRLLDERAAGRPQAADLPLALSAVLLATAGALTSLLYALPQLASWYVRTHGGPNPSPERVARGVEYLRGEGWAAVATTAAVVVLFALFRVRRVPARALSLAAVALLGADLWHYGHGLVATLPAAAYSTPPPYLRPLLPPETRLFVEAVVGGEPSFVPRSDEPQTASIRALLLRSEPYSGLMWGVPYALHEDYDLMLTRWGSRALTVLHAEWKQPQPELAQRFLGSWNVGALLLRKESRVWAEDLARDPGALPVYPVRNPYPLPRYRFAPRGSFHATWGSALYVARSERYQVDRHEHCVREGQAPGTVDYPAPARVLEVAEEGGRIRVRYRADGPAFFTAAVTFDEGWRGEVDGVEGREAVALFPTAAGQIAMELPAGERELVLRYHDPLIAVGAGVTGLAALGWAALLWTLARRERRQAHPPAPALP